jgi:hypothetical protein
LRRGEKITRLQSVGLALGLTAVFKTWPRWVRLGIARMRNVNTAIAETECRRSLLNQDVETTIRPHRKRSELLKFGLIARCRREKFQDRELHSLWLAGLQSAGAVDRRQLCG